MLLQNDEVIIERREEAIDLGLPQLETFVSEDDGAGFKVNNVDIVSINIHIFETDNQLLIVLLSEHKHVGIADVKLVSSIDNHATIKDILLDNFAILFIFFFHDRLSLVHLNQIVSKLISTLVGQNVEVTFVVDNGLNRRDLELSINV